MARNRSRTYSGTRDRGVGVKCVPKKGGCGGKGTWGKAGSDDNLPVPTSTHDPNYDES